MWHAWSFAIARLAIALAIAVVVGLITGHVALWITLVLGGTLAWQFSILFRLQRWLRHRSHEDPPDVGGVWGDVIATIARIYRRKQYHKRRMGKLFRDFRRLTTALPDGAVLLSVNREILWFNRAAALMLGLKRKADRGMPIENLIRQPEFTDYLQRGGAGSGIIIRVKGGSVCLALVVISVGGQHLLLVRDVTREVMLEQMRKDFVANASHELRSPLTVISGYLDELGEESGLAAEWRDPLADMRRQAARMREIVDDLLELSRLESTLDEAPLLAVDMASLLERLVREARASDAAAAQLALDLDRSVGILGSETELHSIAWNLIWNAVKYTPAGGTVTVRWAREPGGARLDVQDTGIGIAAEHLPRLTERFYRVDRGRARSKGGSGLGLSIVKHGLQRHGGRLEIASQEGVGSTFTAHFPSRRISPRAEAATKAS